MEDSSKGQLPGVCYFAFPLILPAFWNEVVMSGASAATLAYEAKMRMEVNTKDEGKERRNLQS